MALNISGKPGQRYVLGLQRSQLQRVIQLSSHLLAYNQKMLNMTPPIPFLGSTLAVQMANVNIAMQQLIAQVIVPQP